MFRRIPRSIWLVTCPLAILMGIWPGIGLQQPNWVFFGALFGWPTFVLGFFAILAHNTGDHSFWPQMFAALGYPLAMLAYATCAYWTIRSTHLMRSGLVVTVVAAVVSTLASIPVAIVTMSIIQHLNFFSTLFSYPPAVFLHALILINLLISALFGWLIAMGITKLGRGAKQ